MSALWEETLTKIGEYESQIQDLEKQIRDGQHEISGLAARRDALEAEIQILQMEKFSGNG
ncbi:hypothetical protein H072_10625 [Dactylellina haptotyla CBS 200.50]|uniref:Uncharacterized protein n=1 Tax=Dactylellina haptotyla (strain CBS 200.50) TaxID=1284197 RepID=S7ZZP1_DACHA|nr:hypothetical protein H072_10625 [Dactylellina haptotyla CBS 200.50]